MEMNLNIVRWCFPSSFPYLEKWNLKSIHVTKGRARRLQCKIILTLRSVKNVIDNWEARTSAILNWVNLYWWLKNLKKRVKTRGLFRECINKLPLLPLNTLDVTSICSKRFDSMLIMLTAKKWKHWRVLCFPYDTTRK